MNKVIKQHPIKDMYVLFVNERWNMLTGILINHPDQVTEIVIPDKVNGCEIDKIDAEVFKDLTKITKVVLADKINQIGREAFVGCKSLEVVVGTGVKHIHKEAFKGCTRLVEFQGLPLDAYIHLDAFADCNKLTTKH